MNEQGDQGNKKKCANVEKLTIQQQELVDCECARLSRKQEKVCKCGEINYLFGIIHVVLYGYIAFVSMVYGDFMLNLFIFLPLDI